MSLPVDYYFTPQSPWAYLGHARFAQIARAAGAAVRVLPIDLGGKVFPVSGGLPLGQRAPQRQAYRLIELQRHADFLHLPIHVKPKFFPVSGDDASRLIIAVDLHDGVDAAMKISGAVFSACWAQERHIASEKVLAELLAECGLDAARLEQSYSQAAAWAAEGPRSRRRGCLQRSSRCRCRPRVPLAELIVGRRGARVNAARGAVGLRAAAGSGW